MAYKLQIFFFLLFVFGLGGIINCVKIFINKQYSTVQVWG